ncbi:fused MFS/spermidine synthase [Roseobacter ponti]|uniref:Spermidine synthase n=1 Tax=Roseobacter ponti TaxID=1891787 RepID=A0A858SXI5_9RHOB|nr:fused MFS/spermidine synthase [Roseobacter ponti]QJF52353.1 spermidine synthase [Roseobacter ponti]
MNTETPAKESPPFWLLITLQTGISAAGLVVEIVAARMIAPYVGMSLYTWTAIIAVVLAGFSLGHWWGGRLAALPTRTAMMRIGWVLAAAAVFTAGASLILRLVALPVLQSVENPLTAISFIAIAAFFLPSLFAGVPAPVLAVVAMRGRQRSEEALGVMFAAGAMGAIVGTLLAGFLFISWLGSAATLQIMAAFYAVSALVVILCGRGGNATRAGAAGTIALTGLLAWHSLTAPPVCTVESSYFCIRSETLSADAEPLMRVMIIDHLAHGISAKDHPGVMYTDHTAMLDALPRMRMGHRPFSSFHIGGGTYSVPRGWASHGLTDMVVAEIDPEVTKMATDAFWFEPATATVLHEDARHALLSTEKEYDVIVGDAFTDIAVPAHLVTLEFFQLVSQRLSGGGIFAMNVVDNVDRLAALSAVYKTLLAVFPSVEVWTKAQPPRPGERRVFVILAGQSDSQVSEITTGAPDPVTFAPLASAFLSETVARTNAPLLTDDFAPVDRLMGLGSVLD